MEIKTNISRSAMIKVGTVFEIRQGTGQPWKRKYTYRHVVPESDGWIDVKKYLPDDFDLVWIKRKHGDPVAGWINDRKWYGFRLKLYDSVVGWKKRKEKEE